MEDIVEFDIDQIVKEFYPPTTLPLEDYQYEKSVKHRRKRRSIYPSYMPELRILRHDIRRKYGDMFVNVSNNRDLGLMTGLFGDFVRPDCVIDGIAPKSKVNRNIAEISNTRPGADIERFLYGFAMSCKMLPDKVLRLQECQVRTRQGSQGIIIVLKTLATCVQLFTPNSLQVKGSEHKLQCDAFDVDDDKANGSQNSLSSTDSDSSDESSLSEETPLIISKLRNNTI